MKTLRLSLLALLALAPLGCRAGSSSGTMTSRDIVVTAQVARIGESDQFRTELTIERLHEDGSTEILSAPSVLSLAGQRAEIRIAGDDTRLIAMVDVPGPDDRRETVRVQVTIAEPGGLRSPSMRLPVPPAGPEPETDPADTAETTG